MTTTIEATRPAATRPAGTTPLRERMIADMTARKLHPLTQKAHIRSCKRFAAFLGRSPETATADDIKAFQLHMAAAPTGVGTRNTVMSGVKFLLRVTMRRHDLAAEIYHLREPKRVPLVLSKDEARHLLASAVSLKARAMLTLAYGCGLRAGEVVRLKVGDIDRERKIIRIVQSKGAKDRQVMLSDKIYALLREWWLERPNHGDANAPAKERYVFPGRTPGAHLTTRQLRRLLDETAKASGITKPLTMHCLRHSFATHLLERGVNVRLIQAMLGHAQLDTTARYTHVTTNMIAEVASPLDDIDVDNKKRRTRKKRSR
jgi:integrase/recombinase XerD